jgi:hypothetical protein
MMRDGERMSAAATPQRANLSPAGGSAAAAPASVGVLR